MDCKEALPRIHEHLDGLLKGPEALELKRHLLTCPDCKRIYREMETAEALVRSMPHLKAPDDMTDRIMGVLPRPAKRSSWMKWVKRHPAVSVASVFVLVMLSSFLSLWNQDPDMVVKGAQLDQLVIQGNKVILPQGRRVDGNLMVKNGSIQVEGDLEGNLVVIDGSYNLASTAKVAGQVKEIDQALTWLWYQMNEVVSDFSSK